MKKSLNTLLSICLLSISFVSFAEEASKPSLALLPVRGMIPLLIDLMKAQALNPKIAEDDNSYAGYKRKMLADFDAFKRGGASTDELKRRQAELNKALAIRMQDEKSRIEGGIIQVVSEELEQGYGVISGQPIENALADNHQTAECLEDSCVQTISRSLNSPFVGIASISKSKKGYWLQFQIKNVATGKVLHNKKEECVSCNDIQLILKFKSLSHLPVVVAPVKVVAAPVVISPVKVVAAPVAVAPAAPVATNYADKCYADDFVEICVKKMAGQKNKKPVFNIVARNLTQEPVLIANSYTKDTITDDEGNTCDTSVKGLLFHGGTRSPSDYNLIKAAGFINIQLVWGCDAKATGSTFDIQLTLFRLDGEKPEPFTAPLQNLSW